MVCPVSGIKIIINLFHSALSIVSSTTDPPSTRETFNHHPKPSLLLSFLSTLHGILMIMARLIDRQRTTHFRQRNLSILLLGERETCFPISHLYAYQITLAANKKQTKKCFVTHRMMMITARYVYV